MRDKMRTENTKMRVIKGERIWNSDRERERENRGWYLLQLQTEPPRKAKLPVLLKRIHRHNISLGTIFYMYIYIYIKRNEIKDYFYGMGWTSYEFEWLVDFFKRIFCSFVVVWPNFVVVWTILAIIWPSFYCCSSLRGMDYVWGSRFLFEWEMLYPQHFPNNFTIYYRWQTIIDV